MSIPGKLKAVRVDDWPQYIQERNTSMSNTSAVKQVVDLKEQHKETWREMPESYWYQRLVGEVGELGCSLAGDHDDPPEWELTQIAAICLNWLEMRAGG